MIARLSTVLAAAAFALAGPALACKDAPSSKDASAGNATVAEAPASQAAAKPADKKAPQSKTESKADAKRSG